MPMALLSYHRHIARERPFECHSRTMSVITIHVESRTHRYPVLIGEGLTARLPSLLEEYCAGRRPFIVSSPNVWKFHGRKVADALPDVRPILVPDGERYKQLNTVSRVYEALIRSEADRHAVVVAVGGGVLGDTVGFAAATYLRGVDLVHVPTTLLAQVDSAIGGKVGVNHPLGKNLIGAFHPPLAVISDPTLLSTLPRREFRSGLYEVVKYGVMADRALFDRLITEMGAIFDREPEALVPIIAECVRIKGRIVGADEREGGLRRILNLGHTAGHALEAITRYRRFRHGEAVGYGLIAVAELAHGRGSLPAADRDAIRALLVQMGPLPPVGDLVAALAVEAIRRDKKVVHGRLHVVLPTAIGEVTVVDDVTEDEMLAALKMIGLRG